MDVEYVRDMLVSATNLGPNSMAVFEKMMRSIDRRPAIVPSLFPDLRPVTIGGLETGTFSVDLKRFDRVMAAIAQGIHYRDFGEKRRYWGIFCPSFYSSESVAIRRDAFDPVRRAVATLKYKYEAAAAPSVFCYGRTPRTAQGCVYQLIFYDVVIVNAWPERRRVL